MARASKGSAGMLEERECTGRDCNSRLMSLQRATHDTKPTTAKVSDCSDL